MKVIEGEEGGGDGGGDLVNEMKPEKWLYAFFEIMVTLIDNYY